MNRRFLILLATAVAMPGFSAMAAVKVAATHPLIGDLLRQVGGSHVTVVDLLKPGGDAHHFEPTASDLRELRGAKAVFASGKHLESYLDKLADSLGSGVKIIEVGRTIPSLKIESGNEVFLCCPTHAKGGIDPHWWHSAENMARAARIVADELAALDPAQAAAYKAGGAATAKKMLGLKAWAQQQLAPVPRGERKLVTAHAAFGYLCKEYGLKFIPLLGLSREEDYSPVYIAEAIKTIRSHRIRAVFPEDQANPKIIGEIVRETGAETGKPLIADGTAAGKGSTFEGMFRHNITAIAEALKP
ncbi:MAG: metal ABC transporter substrate-binding protein [Verrucomicrobiales bacterium]